MAKRADDLTALALPNLIRHAQQSPPGDTRAFGELVARYKQYVFATAYRLMSNREDAEDLSQEIFLKVYHRLNTLEDPATFTTWISRITTNTCLDALKQKGRRADRLVLEEEGWVEEVPAPQVATPDGTAIRKERYACIETTLADLEPNVRAILVLRDVEDRPYQEIADVLGLGLSTVKMRIHRARLAFQQLFERICPGLRVG